MKLKINIYIVVLIYILTACGGGEANPIEQTQTAVGQTQIALEQTRAFLNLGPTQTALAEEQAVLDTQVAALTPTETDTHTPTATHTPSLPPAPPSATPGERWGIDSTISGSSGSLSTWQNAIPVAWRNVNEDSSRYRIRLGQSDSAVETCEYSRLSFGPTTFRVFLRQITVAATITDLTTTTTVSSEAFRGNRPRCPDTVIHGEAETSRTDYGSVPSVSIFERWLINTLIAEEDSALVTLTPTPTNTATASRTPTATRTSTATATQRPLHTPSGLTPIPDGNSVIFTGTVLIRDENRAVIARLDQGVYSLLGITDSDYVILFEGHPSYVSLTSSNAHLSIPFTPTLTATATETATFTSTVTLTSTVTHTPRPPHTPSGLTPAPEGNSLIVTGTVVIRDENGATLAHVDSGEYPLLGTTDTTYVILYEGHPSYVLLSARNAHLSSEE